MQANKELSSEQKKARRVAKVNSELAKLEEMVSSNYEACRLEYND